MVATPFASGRAMALAMVGLLLFTLLPIVPVAQAQAVVASLAVDPGDAVFFQQNFDGGQTPTSFVTTGNNQAKLSVRVTNIGAGVSNVPVYYQTEGGGPSGCMLIGDLPAGAPATSDTPAQPGVKWANTSGFPIGGLEAGAYNVSILVMPDAKPAGVAECTGNTGPLARPTSGGCVPGPTTNCVVDTDMSDNVANAFVVKDYYLRLRLGESRWCDGLPSPTAACSPLERPLTATGDDAAWTYFEVDVHNDGTYGGYIDYGRCRAPADCTKGFVYNMSVTIRGLNIPNGTQNLSANQDMAVQLLSDDVGHRARSSEFDLRNHAGPYVVNFTLDAKGKFRRSPITSPSITKTFTIEAPELTGNFVPADFKTTSTDPYPYDGAFTIGGRVTFRNIGNVTTPTVNYSIYLNNLSDPEPTEPGCIRFRCAGQIVLAQIGEDGSSYTHWFNMSATSTNEPNLPYLPPGKHTLFARIDSKNVTLESNETNNTFSVDIFVRDSTKPVFANLPKITATHTDGVNAPARSVFSPHEPFNVHINVTDDDHSNMVVQVNFTNKENTSFSRVYNAIPSQSGRFTAQIWNFSFYNFSNVTPGQHENWTMRVHATDASGNTNLSGAQDFKLVAWPIHTAPIGYVIIQPTWPNATTSLATGQNPQWRIRVPANLTGFDGTNATERPDQRNYTGNLALNVTTPKNTHNLGPDAWTANTPQACFDTPDNRFLPGEVCDAESENTFSAGLVMKEEPGRWNYSIRVKDVAGHWRIINGTWLIEDLPPVLEALTISNRTLEPGQRLQLHANLSDDVKDLDAVYLNLTRTNPGDNRHVNITMTNKTEVNGYFHYNESYETGRGKTLGLGGTFNVTIVSLDGAGNWAHNASGNITIVDEAAPQLTGYGVLPPVARVGDNVTFWARGRDATNITMRLDVFRGSTQSGELLFDEPIMLTEGPDGNFTATVNFTAEHIHAWSITPVDSVNKVGAAGIGSITVRDNIGPSFEVLSPRTVIEGTRYARATPRIEVAIYDVEGVVRNSVELRVDGERINPAKLDLLPEPGNRNGYLLVYEVPAEGKFTHNDVIKVVVSATDNSTDSLSGNMTFSFTVDDVAPTARLVSVAPSYRDQPGHVLNVSLNSRFMLEASDNDGLATSVDSIRYRVSSTSSQSGSETVYTGPFRLLDVPNVRTGEYTITFLAEDEVGNAGRVNLTKIYVDDTPPALSSFLPQNRQLTATWIDDRVGVNRTVVWYRLNDQPYVALQLTEQDGTWSITLPEGQKNDRVSYYLQAWDRLENSAEVGSRTAPHHSFNISNNEPTIKIKTPQSGSRISRTFDLTWDAHDPDTGDALVFTIYVKRPGKQAFDEIEQIRNTNTRSKTMRVDTYADGEYTFRVSVSDGGFVNLSDTTVTIINAADPIGTVSVKGNAVPGESMLITAEVSKSNAIVEAHLYLDGKLVSKHTMNDAGNDGDAVPNDKIYSVRVPVDGAGEYTVEIFTTYQEGGETKTDTKKDAAVFSARLTPGYVLKSYGVLLGVVGLLAAVGIGVAVFVVMRRR